jgi:hypothetical protein
MLDYILFNQGVISQLKSYEILSEGSISSTSDHLPIVVKIKLDYNPHRLSYSYMKSPAWQKINDENLKSYQEFLNDPLYNLTLDYMKKTLNQIIFFSSTKIRIFFSATLGIRIFFLEKQSITWWRYR